MLRLVQKLLPRAWSPVLEEGTLRLQVEGEALHLLPVNPWTLLLLSTPGLVWAEHRERAEAWARLLNALTPPGPRRAFVGLEALTPPVVSVHLGEEVPLWGLPFLRGRVLSLVEATRRARALLKALAQATAPDGMTP